MALWVAEIDIKTPLNEFSSGTITFQQLRVKISELLKNNFPELSREFRVCRKTTDHRTFNDLLARLYDEADDKRIWLGI